MARSTTTVEASAAGSLRLGGELEVNRMGFGAMRLAGEGIWGEPENPEEAKRVLRRAVELGVQFIDTADSYGPEVSERLIAEALHPYPADLVIATKGGLRRGVPATGHGTRVRNACGRRARGACVDGGSRRSISTSSTRPTRRCRSRTPRDR